MEQTTGVLSMLVSVYTSGRTSYDFSVRVRDSIYPYREALCRVNVVVTSAEQTNEPIYTTPPSEGFTYTVDEVRLSLFFILVFPSDKMWNVFNTLNLIFRSLVIIQLS